MARVGCTAPACQAAPGPCLEAPDPAASSFGPGAAQEAVLGVAAGQAAAAAEV